MPPEVVVRVWWIVCLLALAPFAGADSDVYKWVDEDGNVHFSDKPPAQADSETLHVEADAPADAAAARSRFLADERERARRRAEVRQAAASVEATAAAQREAMQERCVRARQQLISLQQSLPVYRDEDGVFRTLSRYDAYEGAREYLDETERKREIVRVEHEIVRTCEDPDDATEILSAARDRALAKRCEAARVNLEAVQQRDARSARSTIEKARRAVERYCVNDQR